MDAVHKVRSFNRFYTKVIGLLDSYVVGSSYTLPEVRVMYEIYHYKKITATKISELLGMDKSHLSRMLLGFAKKGMIQKKTTKKDGRAQDISMTKKGKREFLKVNEATENQIMELLSGLTKQEILQLISHMNGIQKVLFRIRPTNG